MPIVNTMCVLMSTPLSLAAQLVMEAEPERLIAPDTGPALVEPNLAVSPVDPNASIVAAMIVKVPDLSLIVLRASRLATAVPICNLR